MANSANIKKFVKSLQVICHLVSAKVLNPSLCLFEGAKIMKWAKEAGLTGRSYVWIVTQSVIGEGTALADLPAGMLGK